MFLNTFAVFGLLVGMLVEGVLFLFAVLLVFECVVFALVLASIGARQHVVLSCGVGSAQVCSKKVFFYCIG